MPGRKDLEWLLMNMNHATKSLKLYTHSLCCIKNSHYSLIFVLTVLMSGGWKKLSVASVLCFLNRVFSASRLHCRPQSDPFLFDRSPVQGAELLLTDPRGSWCFWGHLTEPSRSRCHCSVTALSLVPWLVPAMVHCPTQLSWHPAKLPALSNMSAPLAGLFLIHIDICDTLTGWFEEEICQHGMGELFHGCTWQYKVGMSNRGAKL